MELRRKSALKIKNWYTRKKNALLVTGVRQAGKTHLIRKVLTDLKCNYIEINLIEMPEAVAVLKQVNTVDDLITGLSVLVKEKPVKGSTVIFFDEIQMYREMVTKIKFLVDEGSFRYILSGSMLGVELTGLSSAPVGYLDILRLFPLDFEEFLQISNIDGNVLDKIKKCFISRTAVMDTVNSKMMELFTRYLMVGGMPAAVSAFADSGSINDIMAIHDNIRALYKLDFTKYEADDKKLMISNAYDLIPSELLKQNKRFVITDLRKGLRFERIESTFLWLNNAGVALPVYNSTEPRVPLRINEKHSLFKLYLSDVGMLTSVYGMNTKRMLLAGAPALNAGGIYENAVAQELVSKGFMPYYYNSNRLGELDFVIENNDGVLPVEVKSGKDYTIHSAINHSLNTPEFGIKEAFVFANCNVSQKGKVTYLPVYMVMFLSKDEDDLILGSL